MMDAKLKKQIEEFYDEVIAERTRQGAAHDVAKRQAIQAATTLLSAMTSLDEDIAEILVEKLIIARSAQLAA